MGATFVRSAQPAEDHARRQDLRTFSNGAASSTNPMAMGHVACDSDGAALMGRVMHDTTDVTQATGTAQTALAAYAKRARLMLQNLSDDTEIWFDFGTTAVASACFRLFPGQMLQLTGDACPPDLLSIVTTTGTANFYAKDW